MVSSSYYIQDNSDIESKTFEAARNHYNEGKYSDAIKLYSGMLNTSLSYKLYYEIGRCYYKLNEFLPAEEYFKKSIGLEELKNPSYLYLGNIYYKREDLKNAIENWAAAYAYKPDDEAACLNLATSYFSKGMKFQSVFYYEKYLKYAKEKGSSYNAIKESISKCVEIGMDFYNKAKRELSSGNNKSAIEYLTFAVKNMPVNFDINYLLGKVYFEENDYMHSLIYLKNALCFDNKSLDVLQKLAEVYLNLGDYTSAYCVLKRMLSLIIHNQQEYLKTMKLIAELDTSFDAYSYQGHLQWAERYDNENNYHMALLEYENCIILKESLKDELGSRVERLKSYLYPEQRIVKICLEKGGTLYNDGDYKTANKYFSKVMLLSDKNSQEYKLAKSRVVDV